MEKLCILMRVKYSLICYVLFMRSYLTFVAAHQPCATTIIFFLAGARYQKRFPSLELLVAAIPSFIGIVALDYREWKVELKFGGVTHHESMHNITQLLRIDKVLYSLLMHIAHLITEATYDPYYLVSSPDCLSPPGSHLNQRLVLCHRSTVHLVH